MPDLLLEISELETILTILRFQGEFGWGVPGCQVQKALSGVLTQLGS